MAQVTALGPGGYAMTFRVFLPKTVAVPKQLKVGTVITIDHKKVSEGVLVDQNAVDAVTLVDQYKIGDFEFVC